MTRLPDNSRPCEGLIVLRMLPSMPECEESILWMPDTLESCEEMLLLSSSEMKVKELKVRY